MWLGRETTDLGRHSHCVVSYVAADWLYLLCYCLYLPGSTLSDTTIRCQIRWLTLWSIMFRWRLQTWSDGNWNGSLCVTLMLSRLFVFVLCSMMSLCCCKHDFHRRSQQCVTTPLATADASTEIHCSPRDVTPTLVQFLSPLDMFHSLWYCLSSPPSTCTLAEPTSSLFSSHHKFRVTIICSPPLGPFLTLSPNTHSVFPC